MTLHVTSIGPAPDLVMPAIAAYMALAEAMHDNDDNCQANYVLPFSECATREYDIEQAVKVLVDLMHDDWHLVRRPVTAELGL
jgi:hypothetical protein